MYEWEPQTGGLVYIYGAGVIITYVVFPSIVDTWTVLLITAIRTVLRPVAHLAVMVTVGASLARFHVRLGTHTRCCERRHGRRDNGFTRTTMCDGRHDLLVTLKHRVGRGLSDPRVILAHFETLVELIHYFNPVL